MFSLFFFVHFFTFSVCVRVCFLFLVFIVVVYLARFIVAVFGLRDLPHPVSSCVFFSISLPILFSFRTLQNAFIISLSLPLYFWNVNLKYIWYLLLLPTDAGLNPKKASENFSSHLKIRMQPTSSLPPSLPSSLPSLPIPFANERSSEKLEIRDSHYYRIFFLFLSFLSATRLLFPIKCKLLG